MARITPDQTAEIAALRAETAQTAHDTGPHRGPGRRFDPLDQFVARVDIYARLGIGQPVVPFGHPIPRNALFLMGGS